VSLVAVFLHGFGVRYDLPASLSLYLFAAAAVVAISFVMVVVFAGERVGERAVQYPRREVRSLRGLPRVGWLRALTGAFGVLFLVAVIVTGWFGSSQPDHNPAEYLTWIYFWAGLFMLNGLVGPIWDAINPFRALDSLVRWVRRAPVPVEARPDALERLGVWPAVVLFFCFAWLELASGYSNHPVVVAWVAFGYTVVTVAGTQRFGAASWLGHVEFFTVLFSILRRFAPIQVDGDRVYLRLWGAGLLDPWPAGWDRVTFVVLMLSTLAFDGILATPLWQAVTVDLQPLWGPLGLQWGMAAVKTFGLADVTLIFFVVFAAVMQLVMYLGRVQVDPVATTTLFSLTLVPIAFVYNLAHNYNYLMIQSQGLFPLLADPLGRGWHLLPTQGYQVSFALAQAATVWYAQVFLIVLGHVIAVYLAHLRAGERFKTARNALLSQYPMLLLMVAYTMTSLWILAQPITEGG
jgi:hypothetical protein